MEITRIDAKDVAIVQVSGKLIGSPENCDKFHEFFGAILGEGVKRIVVDLQDTPWANSQGIGMLIGAYASAKKTGAHLMLSGVGERIRDVLDVTKLSLIFETAPTKDEAVERLVAHPAGPASTTRRPNVLAQ